MTFADQFALAKAELESHRNARCVISKIKQAMSEADVAFLDSVLYDEAVKPRIIIAALEKMGHAGLSDQNIRRHRNQVCTTCRKS